MQINLPEEAAKILLLRFYVKSPKAGVLVAPKSAYLIAEAANLGWTPHGKSKIRVDPMRTRILELDRERIEVLEACKYQVNACLMIFRPIIDPSITLMEMRMLSRSGISTINLN